MAKKKGVVTIKDVAQVAGVSISTVSRVLNKKDYISTETQDRVQTVIDQLGFTTSLAAKSMRSRHKNLLGVIVPDLGMPYSIEVMKGINRAIAESSFDLLVYTTGDMKKSGALSHYVNLLNNSLTDGVVIVAYAAGEFISDSRIVAVDPPELNPEYPYTRGTNYQGALDAVDYLIGLGHRRIGFLGGRSTIGSAILRKNGYLDRLGRAGIPVDETLIFSGDFTPESGRRGTLELLSKASQLTAIFASNDWMAMGAMDAIRETGLRIPEDVSIMGFDNIPEAQFMGLTTIDQSIPELGYQAIRMLIKLVNNEELDNQLCEVSTKLVIRTSCRKL